MATYSKLGSYEVAPRSKCIAESSRIFRQIKDGDLYDVATVFISLIRHCYLWVAVVVSDAGFIFVVVAKLPRTAGNIEVSYELRYCIIFTRFFYLLYETNSLVLRSS